MAIQLSHPGARSFRAAAVVYHGFEDDLTNAARTEAEFFANFNERGAFIPYTEYCPAPGSR